MSILKEVGSLTHHTGSITGFQFNENGSKLLTASADASISVWRSSDWNNLGTLKYKPIKGTGKKSMRITAPGIRSLSLHSTGKVALSVCKSGEVCVWDMVKGNLLTFSKPKGLKVAASEIKWISASRYAVVAGDKVAIYDFSNEDGVPSEILEHSSSVLCFTMQSTPANGEYIVCGCADGEMVIWNNRDADSDNGDESEFVRVHSLKAHECRIKAIDSIESPDDGFLVATGTSAGSVVVWSFQCESLSIRPVASYDSSMRITSLVIVPQIIAKKSKKRKNPENHEE